MKKKIFGFILAICLIIPAMFMLTSCGGDEDDGTVKYTVTTPAEFGTGYRLTYDVIANGNNANVEINGNEEISIYLSLEIGYTIGTLQVLVNETPLEIVSVDELTSDFESRLADYTVNRSVVYTFTLTADTNITTTGSTSAHS